MHDPVWRLDGPTARLASDHLTLAVDTSRPRAGLLEICFDGTPLDEAAVLQICDSDRDTEQTALQDCYVRGADLIAVYDRAPDRDIRPRIHWRAITLTENAAAAGVELVISIETDLLDSDPRLTTVTDLPTCEVLRLIDPAAARFEPVAIADRTSIAAGRNHGTGATLFRMPDGPVSYAEMVHPADSAGAELTRAAGALRRRNRLFDERLEKGVIRRARVRGMFLSRRDDERLAARCYEDLLAAAPPLTT